MSHQTPCRNPRNIRWTEFTAILHIPYMLRFLAISLPKQDICVLAHVVHFRRSVKWIRTDREEQLHGLRSQNVSAWTDLEAVQISGEKNQKEGLEIVRGFDKSDTKTINKK